MDSFNRPDPRFAAGRAICARPRAFRRPGGGGGAHHRDLRQSVGAIRTAFASAAQGGELRRVDACYPYVFVPVGRSELHIDARLSYGVLLEPGTYGTTLTRPDLFGAITRSRSATS